MSKAYLQGGDNLQREVFVKPPAEFELKINQILKLMKLLYELTDSGDYWHHTLNRYLRDDMEMSPTTRDL